ncbi:MAG: NAD/FAD-utilizing enzyme [Gammaproteobacteria bacterium]|nr:NAD/FAD-utilizing enzyme [Gammaproteobacteria bacterium]MBQ0840318.1 NAD/FAD-utilizing enzyme [Gammaproteobacteria bacterium]
MDRYFFISGDLDDMDRVEKELENAGVTTAQIHVLSKDDDGVARRDLHEVHAFMKTDVVRSGLRGAVIGVVAAISVLLFAHYSSAPENIGWLPFIFLSIVLLGFCTWEGGFFGFQVPNIQFRQFEEVLAQGWHVFFVDVNKQQLPVLQGVTDQHRGLKPAGIGSSSPYWLIGWQNQFQKFVHWAP